jgi:hypothetical protein
MLVSRGLDKFQSDAKSAKGSMCGKSEVKLGGNERWRRQKRNASRFLEVRGR